VNLKYFASSLVILALLGFGIFYYPEWQKSGEESSVPQTLGQFRPREYKPAELKEQLAQRDDVIVVDVRRREEYDKGHVPGAIHIEYDNIQALQNLPKDKEIVTYCTLSTWRAPYAAYSLFKSNHANVTLLTGGISYWKQAGEVLASRDNSVGGEVMPKPADLVADSPTEVDGAHPTREFSLDDLGYFDGKESREAYVAVDGVVYDVTDSPLWVNGEHRPAVFAGFLEVKAGHDLTELLKLSPHGIKNLAKFPVVGTMRG
jgi:rhodanese-related sulfurtransferase/predicted heme/steroid binding protein